VFERDLKAKLERIFDLGKVSFDHPGESKEQQGLFVQINTADVRIRDAREVGKALGVIHCFANSDKLPYGYFAKKISEADPEDTRGFFFGPEENVGSFRNIAERKFDFTYLFDSQYDPAIGTITSVNLSYTET
jgi:hypothetical protein